MIKSMKTYPGFCESSDYPNTHSHASPNNSSPSKPASPPRPPTSRPSTNYDKPESPFSPCSNFTSSYLSFYEANRALKIGNACTKREVILRFRILTRKYYPEKWSCDAPYTKAICAEKFKRIANARDLLLEKLRSSWFCAFWGLLEPFFYFYLFYFIFLYSISWFPIFIVWCSFYKWVIITLDNIVNT